MSEAKLMRLSAFSFGVLWILILVAQEGAAFRLLHGLPPSDFSFAVAS
jgi:hypothetical protein